MNDTVDVIESAPIPEAVALIDNGLSRLQQREIIPAIEVLDLLLDVRCLLDGRSLAPLVPAEPVSAEH